MLAAALVLALASADCATWARGFGDWLQSRTARTTMPLPEDPSPVIAKGTAPPPSGIAVAVAKDAAWVAGRKTAPGELADAIRAAAGTHARVSPEPPPLLLLVHSDAPWSRVVEAVDAARASEIRRVAFLFSTPTDDAKRAKNWVDADAKGFRRIAHDLPAALERCRCAVDRDAAKSLEIARLPERMASALLFDLVPPGGKGAAVVRPAGEPWSTAHAAILDPKLQGKGLVLSVR